MTLARASAAGDGGPFGAVVVRNDHLLGEGANEVTASNDPTAHAEVVADFYDLFGTPRESWTNLRVVRNRLASATAPFDAWRINAQREEY